MSEDEYNKIPKQRAFSLYVILICGILISLLGIYMLFTFEPGTIHMYFDGDRYRQGAPKPWVFIIAGFILSLFPLYHFYKGNHRIK